MSHPFERMLLTALKKCTEDNNEVFETAQGLIEKGYSSAEVCGILKKLEQGLIADTDVEFVREAREELCEADE